MRPRRRHPGDQRGPYVARRAGGLTSRLRSLPLLCSLRHGGSFGSGPADRLVLADPILRPTREDGLWTAGFRPERLAEWGTRVAYKGTRLDGVPEYL